MAGRGHCVYWAGEVVGKAVVPALVLVERARTVGMFDVWVAYVLYPDFHSQVVPSAHCCVGFVPVPAHSCDFVYTACHPGIFISCALITTASIVHKARY